MKACIFALSSALLLTVTAVPAIAVPIQLDLEGSFGQGEIGVDVPDSFLAAIDSSVFGSWTGSLIYDVDDAAYAEDLLTRDAVVVGRRYTGGITEVSLGLANGAHLSQSHAAVEVFDGSSGFPPEFAIFSELSIASVIWRTTPDLWTESFMRLTLLGEDPDTTPSALPPAVLDGVTRISISGSLCGDFDESGTIFLENECVRLVGLASVRAASVPEPASLSLFLLGSSLILAGHARQRGKAT